MNNQVQLDNNTGRTFGRFNIAGKYNYGIEISNVHNGIVLSRQILDYDLVAEETLSSDDQDLKDRFVVFPNPSAGDLTFQNNYAGLPSSASLVIFDIKGNIVKRTDISAGKRHTTFSLNPGLYMMALFSEGHLLWIEKLVVR
jgi:hypothetical protein